jgi:hypothetical protein
MILPDHLSTKVVYEDNVLVVEDDRNSGESDADFAARHGRHILAAISQITDLETLTITTFKKEDETISDCVGRHVWKLLN